MQTFMIVAMGILLSIAGILELFTSNEKEPRKELPAADTSTSGKKGKAKD